MATSKPLKSAYSFLPNHQPFLLHSSSLAASSIFSQANPDPSPYSIYNTPLSSTTSSQPFSVATRPSEWGRNEKVLCSLKHKLLVFLFKKMSAKGVSGGGGRKHLSNFYKYFDFLVKLKMWRMQMLDEDHLLIRCLRVSVAFCGDLQMIFLICIIYYFSYQLKSIISLSFSNYC